MKFPSEERITSAFFIRKKVVTKYFWPRLVFFFLASILGLRNSTFRFSICYMIMNLNKQSSIICKCIQVSSLRPRWVRQEKAVVDGWQLYIGKRLRNTIQNHM